VNAEDAVCVAQALAAGLCTEALPGSVILLRCSLNADHAPSPHRAVVDCNNPEVFVQWPCGYDGPKR
jgi:hypothetical protein